MMLIKEIRRLYRENKLMDMLHEMTDQTYRYFFSRLSYISLMHKSEEIISLPDDIIEIVKDSVIDELPKEEPECMKRPYCIRCDSGFDSMKEIYFCRYNHDDPDNFDGESVPEGDMYFCLGCSQGKRLFTSNFVINWKEGKIYTGECKEPENLENFEWNDRYVKFLITFAFLYNAENSPIVRKTYVHKATKIQRKSGKPDDIDIKLSLDEAFKKMAEGIVHVRGHLRNQACGVQWSERKIIYIAPFEYERMLIVQEEDK